MIIIPDTNFLVYLSKYKLWHELERFKPYSLLVLPEVMYELKALTKFLKGKDKEAVKIAVALIDKLKVKEMKGNTDEKIVEKALSLKEKNKPFVVATMDKRLIKKLKSKGVKCLIIRQKKYLEEI